MRYPSFREFINPDDTKNTPSATDQNPITQTSEERIDAAQKEIEKTLASDLQAEVLKLKW